MDIINIPALIVAAIVPFLTGFLWYSLLLGKQWMASTGKTEEDLKERNIGVIFGVSFLMNLILGFALKIFIETTHGGHLACEGVGSYHTVSHGLFHGALYIGFFALPLFMVNGLFERRGQVNTWIHIGYWVLTGALMGAILDAWI